MMDLSEEDDEEQGGNAGGSSVATYKRVQVTRELTI
jgi:hypothetical protein